jgi:hypothetical protein
MNPLFSCLAGIYLHLLSLRDGKTLIFKTIAHACPCCGRHMEPKRSGERTIVTLAGGTSTIVEEYFVCPFCKDADTGRRVIRHSEALRGILPLNTKYGYDVEIEAGHLQYADNRQTREIKSIFEGAHGISIPQSQIHELGIRFLAHMVVNHWLSAPLLAGLFKSGCVYHVDATCEAGRGMEMSVKEGWTGILLGVWKIPTENEEIIKQHLKSVVATFGEPIAFVSDLGNGMMAAIAGVVQEMQLRSRHLVCHMHFLKAVGKSILEKMHQTLKSQFRAQKTLVRLNRFVKETGEIIKPQAAAMRDFVGRWQKSGARPRAANHMESIAVLRALAQWALLYGTECSGEGFPFALSHVKLFDRCDASLRSLLSLSGNNCFQDSAAKHAQRLLRILQDPVGDPEMQKTVRGLKETNAVFKELREILRLEKTDVYKQEKDKKAPDELAAVAKLKEEASRFYGTLIERMETGSATDAQASAYSAVIAYFDRYEPYLFGHFAVTYNASGDIVVKLIERSNNIMERSYRDQKHQIRRRTGAKNLGFIFEHQSPASSMMANLENPAYKQAVLNNKTRGDLVKLISSLDDTMDYRDTPMFQDDYELVGGRMPKADKTIVGKPGFTEVVYMLSNECSLPVSAGCLA